MHFPKQKDSQDIDMERTRKDVQTTFSVASDEGPLGDSRWLVLRQLAVEQWGVSVDIPVWELGQLHCDLVLGVAYDDMLNFRAVIVPT